jgi:flavodoxin
MKTLVAYYSRTGRTKKIAQAISNNLGSDIEEIIATKKRSGPFGYLRSGREAMGKKLAMINGIKNDPSSYDLVIIGTPVWASTMSSPVRTYIHQNKNRFKNVAFFCTMGGSDFETTFSQMEELCEKKPIGSLYVEVMDVLKENYNDRIKKFIDDIQK